MNSKSKGKTLALFALAACALAVLVFLTSHVIIPNSKYNKAVAQMDAGDYDQALAAFEALEGYKDSAEKIDACKTAIQDEKYSDALVLMDLGNYKEALAILETLDGYKNSIQLIEDCKTGILEDGYNKAVALMEAEEYAQAIPVLEELNIYKDSRKKLAEAITGDTYNKAVALLEKGNVVEAYDALISLGKYRDSRELAASVYEQYKAEKLQTAEVGDYVIFGSYEQNNKTEDGKEEIEWLVLDRKKNANQILVISKYGLDCQSYYGTPRPFNWENSVFRKWLNDYFLNEAFSEAESARILTVTNCSDGYVGNGKYAGVYTDDQIFLLDSEEAKTYFLTEEERICEITAYAYAKGAKRFSGKSWWGLRDCGENGEGPCFVRDDGIVNEAGLDQWNYPFVYVGTKLYDPSGALRPAMWIDLDS